MSKKENATTYDELLSLAEEYGVQDNAMFVAAAEQYDTQSRVIKMIKDSILENGSPITTKEYVKGRENVLPHPLIKELPKHSDSANKTLQTMLDIINKLGRKQEKESALSLLDKELS